VRFICGTQEQHLELERRLSAFLGTEDAILFSSCFDANGGVFETLFGGGRDHLGRAQPRVDHRRDPPLEGAPAALPEPRHGDLEEQLKAAADARFQVIVTDGVFSMDGYIAPLAEICDLAERYDALVFVDDSHAVGFIGEHGRGTPELCGVEGRVDIYTGTFGKALGGASGGYVAGTATSWPRCASVPGRTCSPTRSPRRSSRAPCARSTSSRDPVLRAAAVQHRAVPASHDRGGVRPALGSTRSSWSCSAMPR
jgi:hypothetical protein